MRITISTLKKNSSKHIIKGVVYKPNEVDSQGDWMTAEEVEKMAYSFMKRSAMGSVDTNHDMNLVPAYICESYIAQKNDPDGYPEGSWVVAIKIEDPNIWAGVENGTFGGLSLYGTGIRDDTAAPPV